MTVTRSAPLSNAERQRRYRVRVKGGHVPDPRGTADTPTVLYRHFDAKGALLYVGISLRAMERLAAHMAGSQWAEAISRVELERFPTRDAALAAERQVIKGEKPRHNITHALRLVDDVSDGFSPAFDAAAVLRVVDALFEARQLSTTARMRLREAIMAEAR